jgi:lipopolysaccharide cholinephosphotransferase
MATELSRFRQVTLDLLDIVTGLCAKHDILYWIDTGTLLGARRHGGFIPWDDDLDMCLFYSDYVRLIAILQDFCRQSDRHLLYFADTGVKNWSDFFADTTCLIDAVLPVRIDIIPVKLIRNTPERIAVDKSLANVAMVWNLGKARNPEAILPEHEMWLPAPGDDLEAKRDRFFAEYMNTFGSHPSDLSDPEHWLVEHAFNDAFAFGPHKPVPLSWIFPHRTIEFEGRMVNSPGQTDTYLKNLYGQNFMQPPPKEKQKPGLLSLEYSSFTKAEVTELLSLRRKAVIYNLALDASDPGKSRQLRRKISFMSLAALLLVRGKFSMMMAITRHAWLYFRHGVK